MNELIRVLHVGPLLLDKQALETYRTRNKPERNLKNMMNMYQSQIKTSDSQIWEEIKPEFLNPARKSSL